MTTTKSDLLRGLNEEQQNAVTAPDGPVLVIAGPGSGKTRVLTHRIAYLISECGVPAASILAVTFTNKAAREMRDRIGRLLSPDATFGLVMGTFHSLGVRILRENSGLVADRLGVLRNFSIYDDADQLQSVRQAIVNIGLDPKMVAPRRMLSRIGAAKSSLMTTDELADATATYDDEVVARVYREYERILRRANAVDFDDLLILPIRLFDAEPRLLQRYQERFQYILVDEYQDTNHVQFVLVSALSGLHQNLFVVGDPDQSIYRWRQADIRNILEFQESFPSSQRIDLELNYRSTARILSVADQVIRSNLQRIERKLRTENEDGERISIRELADQQHEAQFVVSEIRRLTISEGYSGADFAVMYRTTAQSRIIEEAFRVSDIAYQIVGGVRFYDRKEVKDILAVLRLIQNPSDLISLERVIENLPIGRGLGPKAMDKIDRWVTVNGLPMLDAFTSMDSDSVNTVAPELNGSARNAAVRLGKVFTQLRLIAEHQPLVQLFDSVAALTGYREALDQENEEDLDRSANILEVRADMEKYDALPPGEALPAYLEQVALIADVDSLDDDRRGRVTLITLHSAKGLEFPVVFVTGVEEGLLPVSRAVEAEFDDPAGIEEERRLFYVGITRAQRLLYITYVGMRMSWGRYQPGMPSRFLDSLPHEHIRDLGRLSRLSPSGMTSLASRARSLSGVQLRTVTEDVVGTAAREYRTGERIFHPKFGEGTIVDVIERRGDQDLAIEFLRHGRKMFQASLAKLDLISD